MCKGNIEMTRTMFILGAGASKPYGFPTGFELREYIINSISDVYNNNRFFKDNGMRLEEFESFASAFKKSRTNSIDLFLSRNKQYELLGKAAIADKIVQCEKEGFDNVIDQDDDWYFYFYNRITEGIINKEFLSKIYNNYEFLTFNYDRSFEAYFAESLFYSFFARNPEYGEIDHSQLPEMDILHIYGSIGSYPKKKYCSSDRYIQEVFKNEIDNLKTIYSERKSSEEIKGKISLVQRVFFLGFGYLPENMEILGINKEYFKDKEVYGTAFGSLDAEIRKIENNFVGAKTVIIENTKNINLLKKYL